MKVIINSTPAAWFLLASTAVAADPKLDAPATVVKGDLSVAKLVGIDLQAITDGRVLTKVYPPNGLAVLPSIDFIQKEPTLLLFGRKPGRYWIIFVLGQPDGKLVFLEKAITVTDQGGTDGKSVLLPTPAAPPRAATGSE